MQSALLVKPCFSRAERAMTRKSEASASEKPPPAATPLMAATTGLRILRISTMQTCT